MAELVPAPVSDPQPEIARDTYRYLRVGMPLIIVGLAAAVAIEAFPSHCLKTSISAYYYAPVHSIFIAALCAIGALLIIYKGVCDSEDALLSLAGVLAIFVAMVPTPRKQGPGEIVCGKHDLPTDYDVTDGVTNNVAAVIIALIAIQAFTLWKFYRTKPTEAPSCGGIVIRAFLWEVVGASAIALKFCNSQFLAYGHYVAAVTMFAAIVLTVGITAFVTGRQVEELSPHKRLYQAAYWIIAGVMVLTVVLIVASHLKLPGHSRHWIIRIEALLIFEFAIYWIIQTIELWRTQNRIALLSPRDAALLSKRRITKLAPDIASDRDTAPEITAPEPQNRHEQLLRIL